MFGFILAKHNARETIKHQCRNLMTREEFNKKLKTIQKRHYVYALCDSQATPFYVGKGTRTKTYHAILRVFVHVNEAKAGKVGPLYDNIRSILARGDEVYYVNLAESNNNDVVLMLESTYINKFRRVKEGGILYNKTIGYQGCSGFQLSESTKLKISLKLKDRQLSIEHRNAVSIGLKKSEKRVQYHQSTLRPIYIDGVYYNSIFDAMKELNLTKAYITYRLYSKWKNNYPNYALAEKPSVYNIQK